MGLSENGLPSNLMVEDIVHDKIDTLSHLYTTPYLKTNPYQIG